MKPLLWFGHFILIGALLSSVSRAENYYSPLLCPVENAYLQVENSTAEVQSFWFQHLGETPFTESYSEIKAHGKLSLPLSDYYSAGETAIALKTQVPGLNFSARCKDSTVEWRLENQTSPWKSLGVGEDDSILNLNLTNLSQQDNALEVSFESFRGILGTQLITLPAAFKNQALLLNLPYGTRFVSFHGKGRWAGKVLSDLSQEVPLHDETLQLHQIPQKRYFLFASLYPETTETFVVPMENPLMIQQTFQQMNDPNSARLLVARIEKSQSGLNRDLSSVYKTPWSWQVAEAQNYADFAHISCNGTPQIVEERLNAWMLETGGTICFWNYRVVRELNPWEITQSPSWLPPAPLSLPHTR
jgi:hypothetical protein